ncbi:ABC transporter substrate-binding protein [Roseomonas xinghualingensis]|uniref:ABC transporter substrate-binding protein n=1 Tax=Roseomonas xinghualingensis TaxID=2986475 RepID=UPI0021F23122|nr:ABC transporter substrate-binding protein [Roseomonas sp. SXEYE001]MCV4206220.1 ABC transporter substrate-binding protein [Roseomonas sp. SXEYE001]
MRRRSFLGSGTALLVAPRISYGAESKVLRFVPQSDVGVFDPAFTTAHVTRNHAYLVYDTLFGTDDGFNVSPQMVEGYVTEDDGRTWRLTLRDGLRFHDGEPVLARDAVASIRRWWRRDAFGQELAAVTDELAAPSDRVVQFRLKRPFAFLPAALGKPSGHMPAIMPERLASGTPDCMMPEIIGSGPFRFSQAEHVAGSRLVYERFAGYVPRMGGTPSRTAGPKIAHVDRVEWRVMPDPATAAAALAAGEVDWIEAPVAGLLPALRRSRDIEMRRIDTEGALPLMRFNHLHAPFDNPAIRRVVLRSVTQADFLIAAAGEDRAFWKDGVGVFAHGTPLASDTGMEALTAPRDLARSRKELLEAGYKGERVVILAPSDHPALNALAKVGAELLARIGFNLDLRMMEWSTLQQHRLKRDCVEQGGWSVYFTHVAGMEASDPASHQNTRGLGLRSNPGWPTSGKLEELRVAWFAAQDLAEQQAVARRLQEQVLIDLPYVPLGQFFEATAYRKSVSGILGGFPLFHNLRKA